MKELNTQEKQIWKRAIQGLKKKYPGYAALLIDGVPKFDAITNTFVFCIPESSNFLRLTLNRPNIKQAITNELCLAANKKVQFVCEVFKEKTGPVKGLVIPDKYKHKSLKENSR